MGESATFSDMTNEDLVVELIARSADHYFDLDHEDVREVEHEVLRRMQ